MLDTKTLTLVDRNNSLLIYLSLNLRSNPLTSSLKISVIVLPSCSAYFSRIRRSDSKR